MDKGSSLGTERLIVRDTSACAACGSCAPRCPVGAIRVVGDRVDLVPEKCVACGYCVTGCAPGCFRVRDDVPAVETLLRSSRPVVALLADEFVAALHPMTVQQIERSLLTLGFCSVETTVLGEEIVAREYEQLHARGETLLTIRSTCPVAVDFVRKRYPAFVPALAPIVPPYVAQARLIKAVYDRGVAVVYVSPCFARKDEWRDPQFGGAVDAAIDFLELRRIIEESAVDAARVSGTARLPRRPSAIKEISLTDGYPRETLAGYDRRDGSVRVVRGLEQIDELLRAISAGEAAPAIVDMLNCEGCIDGPAVTPGLSVFAKRNVETATLAGPGATRVSTRAMLGVLPRPETLRSFVPDRREAPGPTPEDVDDVLAAAGFRRENAPDCGACGWETCVEHATAVYRAESTWERCLPLQRSLWAQQRHASGRTSSPGHVETLDAVTGLWSKRAFTERLEGELARQQRYGGDLSLVLADVDRFAAINDRFGEEAGDAMLHLIAARISASLRVTDCAARWTGDQFAVLLPGTGKTAAFAVAEKLREALGSDAFALASGGYTEHVRVTISAGVAAATGGQSVGGLLDAADSALHAAISRGGDRVHLAAG